MIYSTCKLQFNLIEISLSVNQFISRNGKRLQLSWFHEMKLSTSIYDLVLLHRCLSLSSPWSLLGVLEIYRDTRAYIMDLASKNFVLWYCCHCFTCSTLWGTNICTEKCGMSFFAQNISQGRFLSFAFFREDLIAPKNTCWIWKVETGFLWCMYIHYFKKLSK